MAAADTYHRFIFNGRNLESRKLGGRHGNSESSERAKVSWRQDPELQYRNGFNTMRHHDHDAWLFIR